MNLLFLVLGINFVMNATEVLAVFASVLLYNFEGLSSLGQWANIPQLNVCELHS